MTTLYVDTTARYQNAATSELCARIIVENGAPIIYRPISKSVTEDVINWPEAHFATPKGRTPQQSNALETCDTLSAEFFMAKHIVINLPLTGGVIPGSFKAWVDMIALADNDMDDDCAGGFRTKSATLVVASGGLKAGSEMDNLTPQLICLLDFIGVQDVNIISADQTTPPSPSQTQWSEPLAMAA
jgi:FMN-dependent NADH-azoreductase